VILVFRNNGEEANEFRAVQVIIESFIRKRSFASYPCGKGVSMEEVNGAIQDIAKYQFKQEEKS